MATDPFTPRPPHARGPRAGTRPLSLEDARTRRMEHTGRHRPERARQPLLLRDAMILYSAVSLGCVRDAIHRGPQRGPELRRSDGQEPFRVELD